MDASASAFALAELLYPWVCASVEEQRRTHGARARSLSVSLFLCLSVCLSLSLSQAYLAWAETWLRVWGDAETNFA